MANKDNVKSLPKGGGVMGVAKSRIVNATGSASVSVSIIANAAASVIGSVSGDFEIAATTTGTSIMMSQEIEDIEGRNQVQRKKIQVRRMTKSGPR